MLYYSIQSTYQKISQEILLKTSINSPVFKVHMRKTEAFIFIHLSNFEYMPNVVQFYNLKFV